MSEKLNQASFLQRYQYTLKKSVSQQWNGLAEYVIITESSQIFQMQIDGGATNDMQLGFKYRTRAGDAFQQLTFTNPDSDTDITIEFFVGSGDFDDYRLNTLIDRTIAVGTVDSPTRVVAHNDNILANGTVALSGTNAGNRRKVALIFNDDPNGDLQVLDKDGNACGTVFPRSMVPFETSADLQLKNATANAIQTHVTELFYTLA